MQQRNPGPDLVEWYQKYGRKFPWRQTKDAYRIWVSEIILQQTRVEQGIGYYRRFLQTFPTLKSLANASIDDVLKIWEGLGYYSRARNMHSTAQHLVKELGGKFPDHHSELIKLKGIGPYTSRAIGSLAFGNKAAVLDGNVLRFASRYLNDDSPIDKESTKKKFTEILDEWIADVDPSAMNQAMMDLGSTVCKPTNPACEDCPVQHNCQGLRQGTIDKLPVKAGKTKRSKKYFNYYLVRDKKGHLAIRQRPMNGLWAGLWEIPQEEKGLAEWKGDQRRWKSEHLGEFTHVLSHIDVMIRVYEKEPEEVHGLLTGKFVPISKISNFAFSRAVLKVFEEYLSGFSYNN